MRFLASRWISLPLAFERRGAHLPEYGFIHLAGRHRQRVHPVGLVAWLPSWLRRHSCISVQVRSSILLSCELHLLSSG